jgi:hypothetical protein
VQPQLLKGDEATRHIITVLGPQQAVEPFGSRRTTAGESTGASLMKASRQKASRWAASSR